MSDRKARNVAFAGVLVGILLLVIGVVGALIGSFMVILQVGNLDLTRLDVRASIDNLVWLFFGLTVVCLGLGAIGGYLIGKYRYV